MNGRDAGLGTDDFGAKFHEALQHLQALSGARRGEDGEERIHGDLMDFGDAGKALLGVHEIGADRKGEAGVGFDGEGHSTESVRINNIVSTV